MSNYFLDNPALRHHLTHPLMEKIVAMKERDYKDAETYDYAPINYQDALDNYNRVLEIVGEVSGDTIAQNAEDVDHEGPSVVDGHVKYASGTECNLDTTRQAGLMGLSMPRRFGGLNMAITPYIMAAEIVARADTGFETVWGLQDCAETLYEFASEDQKQRFIPRVCKGETMSMDLTEPDAGSDLQAVMLRATEQPDGTWRLNGVKRFITNGDSDIHLVLARSEAGTKDGRGLSMFVYDKRDGGVTVRRIENKMGIKGSPTCELVFRNAKAELVGSRKLGLIKYVMALMNGARLGIAAQSVGVSEAAYREALAYARDRKQFGKPIIQMPAVYEILATMKAKLDASRALLYECARYVDLYKILEDMAKEQPLAPDQRKEAKTFSRTADALTPLAKGMASEYCNQNAYDAIQIHGGSGFMKDYACERLYRDARITSIYEGTTQLQVVAAIRYVTSGVYLNLIKAYLDQITDKDVVEVLASLTARYAAAVDKVNAAENPALNDFMARRLVEMAAEIIMACLLQLDKQRNDHFAHSAKVYLNLVSAKMSQYSEFIDNFDPKELELYTQE